MKSSPKAADFCVALPPPLQRRKTTTEMTATTITRTPAPRPLPLHLPPLVIHPVTESRAAGNRPLPPLRQYHHRNLKKRNSFPAHRRKPRKRVRRRDRSAPVPTGKPAFHRRNPTPDGETGNTRRQRRAFRRRAKTLISFDRRNPTPSFTRE